MLTYTPDPKIGLSEEMKRALAEIDATDPTQRTAAALYVVLKSQLDQLGYAPGTVPYDARFGSERSRGALLGTAFAVTRGHREAPTQQDFFDTVTAAFTVVFGPDVGPAKALETIDEAGAKNAAINAAAEAANQDTIETFSDDDPSMPMAFYNAATGGTQIQ